LAQQQVMLNDVSQMARKIVAAYQHRLQKGQTDDHSHQGEKYQFKCKLPRTLTSVQGECFST
jgi:hypothetical protein